ncbi:MAG TPA: TRAP transporter small permease [Beijerinckiaceae bacterium]|nr:TRAP transporter small permease [Beijerinckiaceae bacterium]
MSALTRLVFGLARALAVAGGTLLVGIGLLVTGSVLSRWLRNQAVAGDFELVQMGLALAVFAFLPLCQAHRGNIIVDTFTMKLPLRAQRALDGIWDLVFATVAALIAWRLTIGAAEAFRTGSTSMVLAIPIGYAIYACAAMAAFLAIVCLVTATERFRGGP